MPLSNSWVRYFDRTYEQIKSRVLTDLQALVPEMTDHTDSNLYVRTLSIWSGMAEMLGYYIDNSAREAFISKCRLYWSAVAIAEGFDYRVKSSIPATGQLKLTLNTSHVSDIVIPSGTVFSTTNNIQFILESDVTIISGETEAFGDISQVTVEGTLTLGTSNGQPNQSFVLPINVADNGVSVTIGGDVWSLKETLAESIFNSKHCKQTMRRDKTPLLLFGDGHNGLIPASGSDIDVVYKSTLGAEGNLGADTVTEIVSTITLPIGITLSVTNPNPTTNGEGIESLASIKRRVPRHNRTNDRAVNGQDHLDMAELYGGVARAGYDYSCGKRITIYIVPEGGGLASPTLLNNVKAYFEQEKGMLGKIFILKSAGQIRTKLSLDITLFDGFTQSSVIANLTARLNEFFATENRNVNGSVQLSDIYELIENTAGISFSTIQVMKPLPYASPIGDTTVILDWDFSTANVTSVITFKLKMLTSTTFAVYKNNVYLGNGTVAVPFVNSDITFTINGTYTTNDQWSFKLYPNGTFYLQEPSIPVLLAGDLSINANGGI